MDSLCPELMMTDENQKYRYLVLDILNTTSSNYTDGDYFIKLKGKNVLEMPCQMTLDLLTLKLSKLQLGFYLLLVPFISSFADKVSPRFSIYHII